MQLPYFLKAPAVTIIGDKCYTTLIEDLNITDVPCIKYAISKGLGFGIVAGGAIVKVPQIIKIIQAHSAKGISFSAYMLETLSCVITLAYNVRSGYPFSTYGETFFVTLQNLIILGLMLRYAHKSIMALLVISSFLLMGNILGRTTEHLSDDGNIVQLSLVSMNILGFLYKITIPINLLSKVPQIIENYKNSSTGQLSAFTIFNYFAGSLARIYTTMMEVNDTTVLSAFLLSTLFNCILAFQMALYWNNTPAAPKIKSEKGDGLASETKKRVKKLD
ncbi:hypothetical protein FBU30_003092 [Linnemannia zychae]|nr:hypothetical protein FBU30_003092 [Linnemannia zychae]